MIMCGSEYEKPLGKESEYILKIQKILIKMKQKRFVDFSQ